MRNALAVLLLALALPVHAQSLNTMVGVNHMFGRYNFNGVWPVPAGDSARRDYLNEGADEIYATGSRVIKIWLHPNAVSFYHYTANPSFPFGYPFFKTPAERLTYMAQGEQYKRLFDKPFKTFVINVSDNVPIYNSDGTENHGKFGTHLSLFDADGFSAADATRERDAIYNLAVWLLQQYQNTGKTFVIQNWEGDNILTDSGRVPATSARVAAMRTWLNARQDGINAARAAVPASGVTVLGGIEVNHVAKAMTGVYGTLTNDIVPYTSADLYNYSCYDVSRDPALLNQALDYLAAKAPDNARFGKFNIAMTEYGSAQNGDAGGSEVQQLTEVRRMTEAALGWGVRYVILWQVYCNELDLRRFNTPEQPNPSLPAPLPYDQRPTNDQLRGFWLVRPDGSRSLLYDYIKELSARSIKRYALRSASTYYTSADEGGGYAVRAHAPTVQTWEYLAIIDRNGGTLNTGDPVNILTWKGNYLMAHNNGGGYVDATATAASTWETFTIIKTSGTGSIASGNTIALRTGTGHYLYPLNGGGPGNTFFSANATSIGPWQTFTLREWW
jgi:hypothetical protein